ncbi:MAG TPA: amino acid adenylation domain-containing protein [Verrucomicrobiae bacterium]|nr:amino acid adenylation domain-containing protein [Verrucomicrobiae bacterium]
MNPMEAPAESIAIIGMTGRFPAAKDLDQFWRNLRDGVESVSFFTGEEVESSLFEGPPPRNDPNFVKARAILEDSGLFDASFFNVNPKEAEVMDPQHRVFLECAWEALENAGYNPDAYRGLIGVFAGSSMNSYLITNLLTRRDLIGLVGAFQTMLGNDKDFLPTRVSYKLNLRGPSLNVQTACSTSLVAVCLACQNLLNYQCDMALAGGVSITFPQKRGQLYQEGGIISPDGHCRVFDAGAAGTVSGDGVGIVVLKRLSEALADGDHICAVIKGCALNNDGSLKAGYTAPSIDGQAEVIAMAQSNAAVEPDTISYIEAHGTGTPLGDPIEIAGLIRAFRAGTTAKGFCAIGSLKSNIGHLDVAAGVASLIKTVLALQNRQLPPSLHFHHADPNVDFPNSPFYVNDRLREWKPGSGPRRAGVSSFGIGGTNAHVVLEEAPIVEPSGKSRPCQLLLLSARSAPALETATANLVEHLKQHPALDLADVAFTLQAGRKPFGHRRMLVCGDVRDALAALEPRDSKRVLTQEPNESEPPVVFMFPGQGAQHVNMGRELYDTETVFREQVDRCCEILRPHLELDFRSILYPPASEAEAAAKQLTQTLFTQPAMFVIEFALAQLWMSWGVRPRAMIGHSIGEYVAACLAGVFTLEDALAVVAARGRLVQNQPGGVMLVARMPEAELRPHLGRRLSIAAINGPSLCVVSGPADAIESFQSKLEERGVACRRLQTSHAFHSQMMEPALRPFTARVKKVNLDAPRLPWVSNVTGQWITQQEATDPNYWATHLRHTVRFSDGLAELLKDPVRILLEVGPGQTLTTLARQHPARRVEQSALASLNPVQEQPQEARTLLTALGRLCLAGVPVDWAGFYRHERRHRVPLPTYPFERKCYWAEPAGIESGESLRPPKAASPEASEKEPAGEACLDTTESREDATLEKLKAIFQELSGLDLSRADTSATFLELGFDSLFLTQATQAIQKRFGASVTFRQLLDEFSTLEKLADHLGPRKSPGVPGNGSLEAQAASGESGAGVSRSTPRRAAGGGTSVKTVPLTDAQREIWFAAQMGAAVSTAYNESATLDLRGPLQMEALQSALQQLVGRHEALRTTFSPAGDVQYIAAASEIEVPLIDLSNQKERSGERVKEIIEREIQHRFDFVHGPLLRAHVLQLSGQHHLLVLVVHHIICDGWSLAVLVRELGEIYGARSRGARLTLMPATQFGEYAQRQSAQRKGRDRAVAESYWLQQFGDSVPVMELPTDRPRPASRTYAGGYQARVLPSSLASGLRRLSAERGCTTFTTLLAAFNVLLHRLSGQDDLVVGVPAAGQIMSGVKNLVGHCANLLPIRSRTDLNQGFAHYLAAIRQIALNAFEHQVYPFGNLIRKLNLPRDPNRVPLANVTFNVGRLRGRLNFGALQVEVVSNPKRFVNFDINFNVTETDDDFSFDCYFSTELFDEATAARLLNQYETLLGGIISDPERRMGELPLSSETERRQLLVEWNDTALEYPRDKCVHELFEAQAERTPEALAVVGEKKDLTYRELNTQADQLARHLRSLGVGPETLVGLCAERTPTLIVALLAILKAGGAYVPLDPAYPQERLAFILEDTRARVLLTTQPLRQRLNLDLPDLTTVCLDVERHASRSTGRQTAPSRKAAGGNLAYVIYTSGSTGTPKGVAIEHRNAAAFLHWVRSVFSPEELSGVLASTSICFDLSVFELFAPLSWGGTVVLAENAVQLPNRTTHPVTLINAVPSAMSELLRMGRVPESVRTINLAGEPLSTSLVQQLYRLPRLKKVYDLYGPSESTTYSTFALRLPEGRATIGRPIGNTQVYILDRNLQPVPVGVPGELFIGGAGLARGYLNRPELTAERFIGNPFSGDPSARIYRTGDRARYLADGNIEFLGRQDYQVKVRGFRIELGEIEAALRQHASVSASVVIVRQDTPGDARLVAYVVMRPGAADNASALRRFLKEKLPAHMVPSAFVQLERIPLTPNGKTDRRALPAPDVAPSGVEQPSTQRTPTEATLAEVWRDVLGLKQVGVNDDFFELGGHSLLVTQVLSRIRETFQVEVPMRRFFERPTITATAAVIEEMLVEEIKELSEDEARRFAGATR